MSRVKPIKSKLGKAAKIIVENINTNVKEKLHCNQELNTLHIMDWLQNIDNKENCVFIQFDIKEFYCSMINHFMIKTIEYAKFYRCITKQHWDIIFHTRKSLFISIEKL